MRTVPWFNKCFGIKEAKVLQENYFYSHMIIVLVLKHHYMSIYYLLQLELLI